MNSEWATFRFVGSPNITVGCSKSCAGRDKFRLSSQHPTIVFWGLTSLSDAMPTFDRHQSFQCCSLMWWNLWQNICWHSRFVWWYIAKNKRISIETSWSLEITYPVMAGDKEVVRSLCAVPERISWSYRIDIVLDEAGEWQHGVWVGHIEMRYHMLHTVGQEEHVRFPRIPHQVIVGPSNALQELTLRCVDPRFRARVDQWLRPISVYVYLEHLFHQLIAPVQKPPIKYLTDEIHMITNSQSVANWTPNQRQRSRSECRNN